MPTPAGPPLRKVTLNLYEEDCVELQRIHPELWSVRIREIIHDRVLQIKSIGRSPRRTLGDLDEKANQRSTGREETHRRPSHSQDGGYDD